MPKLEPVEMGFTAMDEAVRDLVMRVLPVAQFLRGEGRQLYVAGLCAGALHGAAMIARVSLGPGWRGEVESLFKVVLDRVEGRAPPTERAQGRSVLEQAMASVAARADLDAERGKGGGGP